MRLVPALWISLTTLHMLVRTPRADRPAKQSYKYSSASHLFIISSTWRKKNSVLLVYFYLSCTSRSVAIGIWKIISWMWVAVVVVDIWWGQRIVVQHQVRMIFFNTIIKNGRQPGHPNGCDVGPQKIKRNKLFFEVQVGRAFGRPPAATEHFLKAQETP